MAPDLRSCTSGFSAHDHESSPLPEWIQPNVGNGFIDFVNLTRFVRRCTDVKLNILGIMSYIVGACEGEHLSENSVSFLASLADSPMAFRIEGAQ